MPRNGDIRSFFASSQAGSQQQAASRAPAFPTPAPSATAPTPAVVDPSPSAQTSPPEKPAVCDRMPEHTYEPPSPLSPLRENASISSSPPSIAPRQTYAIDAVIAASDEEDDAGSSDSDLPDIMAPIASKRSVADPCVTPRAKRTAVQFDGMIFSSPLSIRKKHKYDLAALARFNERDEEKRASELRVKVLEEQGEMEARERERQAALKTTVEDEDETDVEDEEGKAGRELKRRLLESVKAEADAAEEDEEGRGKMRVMRALERAADASTGKKAFYFLEETQPDTKGLVVGNAFPTAEAKGPWKILADKQDRVKHFQSGLPFDIQRMFGNMPDEIFLWILDELCHERRRDLAAEYVKLLRICDDQVRRLIRPTLLQRLFKSLGATNEACNLSSAVSLTDEIKDPYRDRDWTCLENFIGLLGCITKSLESSSRAMAMQMLLRLGMDSVAVENFGLAQEWRWTVDLLARSVPGREWANFCQEVCTSVYRSTEKATLRYRAINLLGPVQVPEPPADLQRRTLDLKRRLASVFFFDELSRAEKKPEDTVNIRAIIDRLDDPQFTISAETDYRELAGLMLLLNIALGDAASAKVTPEMCKDFDADVDELTASMKSMYTRVMPQSHGIHVSRIEAKSAMEMIRDRLVYQLRTKKKPRIADMIPADEEDPSLPKQQMFMKGFLQQRKMDKAMPSIETEMMA
ncbi:hypothetical protein N0V93_009552 [Gnomoniopsis smithogilvyi]|uniref:Uncharacterized protein n=1 Tax=Gnomoniopsis smithogilvyi TaxID=1191159 RepID=A0A9W9CTX0_9PEZI|nr:hypothetical protein N0V93_009552 [Gnomoniopsis smithogilvyi]